MGLSAFVKGGMLRHLFASQQFVEPAATLYVAALDPAGKEITAPSYARVPVSTGVHNSGKGSAWNVTENEVSNKLTISFPVAKEQWGEVSACAVYDSISEGNCIFVAPNRKAKNIDEDDRLVIEPGTLTLRVL